MGVVLSAGFPNCIFCAVVFFRNFRSFFFNVFDLLNVLSVLVFLKFVDVLELFRNSLCIL